jgi:succinate dehydrogenase / fumarate reductase cytochrome b subunit
LAECKNRIAERERGWCSCMVPASRPVFLHLTQIKMPVGALTSIAHRISGLVLAAGVPAALYLLAVSLRSEEGFAHAHAVVRLVPAKLAAIVLAWALARHLLAGMRHMLTDVGVGSTLGVARRTAHLVNYGGWPSSRSRSCLLPFTRA